MPEIFAKPCVSAIIEKTVDGESFILVQTRQKQGGGETNGKLEIPAGKIREYEDIFAALKREVKEETGLTVTKIHGEESAVSTQTGGVTTRSFFPFCTTQNLSGAYSILLHTFLCEAKGTPLPSTDETTDIHWIRLDTLKKIVEETPEKIFFMHINALKKYLNQ
ncbi:MAG: NUDIX domain-containing protein [Clostridiales bacterium]|nr:NUDIX domain-containing protein [Clostridiales bacterium]